MSLDVITLPIGEVHPYVRNPRKNVAAIPKVARSIQEFGFRQPIVVDEDHVILAGHTRYAAARRLGLKEVPVHVARGLTPEQAKAYRIADNRTHEESEWDFEVLKGEFAKIEAEGIDIAITGFDTEELRKLMASESDIATIVADAPDENTTGVQALLLKFGNKQVVLSEDELEMLRATFKRYEEMNMGADGFARWICQRDH